jgi:hypothetical protein
VDLIFSWIPFRCFRNSCNTRFPCGHTTKVSSTYPYQRVGLCIAALMAVCSKCSMLKFAINGVRGESYGHSVLLSEKTISHKKNMFVSTHFMRSTVSLRNFCESVCSVSYSGTLVNSVSTLKLTNMSVSFKAIDWILCTNVSEFFI